MGGLRQKINETKIVNDKFSVTRDSKMKVVFFFQKMPKYRRVTDISKGHHFWYRTGFSSQLISQGCS